MGPLNDENKLQVDENNYKKWKNCKILKILKLYKIINFKNIRYELTALGNFIQSILNYKLMRPVIILRLPKDQKTG